MTNHSDAPVAAGRRRPSRWQAGVAILLTLVFVSQAGGQAPAAGGAAAPSAAPDGLESIVGPIALYPDDLVAIILPASTNPLQLVQADRFLEKRKADPKLPVDEKWDESVKALLNYPDIVKKMSGDLDWTAALGEAVVEDQGAVLDAIQVFRRRAQAAGNLKTDGKQVVEVEKEIIKIVPADPQVIYVPQYNPATVVVYGAPAWGYWPTPYPSYYYPYPPGAAFATGVIWGAAIGAAWNGGHWNTNWGGGNNNITVNRNTNINTGNINTGNINRPSQQPAGAGTAWKSNKQPGQVSSTVGRTPSTSERVGDARAGAGGGLGSAGGANRPTTTAGAAGGGGAARDRATSAGSVSATPRDQFGGGSANRGGASGGSAFGGYDSGRQAQRDSSRGASSRSSMPSGGGGGARGGGGRGGGRGR